MRDFSVEYAHNLRVTGFCWKSHAASSSLHANALPALHWSRHVDSVDSVAKEHADSVETGNTRAGEKFNIFNFSTESACSRHVRQLLAQVRRTKRSKQMTITYWLSL